MEFWEIIDHLAEIKALNANIYNVYYSDIDECWIIQYTSGKISRHKQLNNLLKEINNL